ncbi:MAG: hypothetical protein ACRD8O_13950, partial [Bryobacteraceae bacterium]
MCIRLFTVFAIAALPGCLFADFSYEQKSQITGGAMAGAVKFVGVFSKELREPMVSTVLLKGNRLANITKRSTSIIDLDAETFTEINHEKKT